MNCYFCNKELSISTQYVGTDVASCEKCSNSIINAYHYFNTNSDKLRAIALYKPFDIMVQLQFDKNFSTISCSNMPKIINFPYILNITPNNFLDKIKLFITFS